MNNTLDWHHQWFGVWRESGSAYAHCPSIKDFIDKSFAEHHDVGKISKYLETAQIIATTSRVNFPSVLTGEQFSGSLSYRTDGEWLWPDDLAYYVREHNVALPSQMLKTIERHNYKPPLVSTDAIKKLEWPPVVD